MTPDLAAIRARLEAAHSEVVALCDGKRWQMRVPVDEARDSDVVISSALADVDVLLGIVAALRSALLDAEHRLRLLADRTADYGPEGMRSRLIGEYQQIAYAAEIIAGGDS